jgi:hypothetical protein
VDPNSLKFKKLQALWDKKLAKSGFVDAEQRSGHLKKWSTGILKSRVDYGVFKAKEAYFQYAGQFLHSHKFDDVKDSLIWKYHAEGLSTYQIVTALRKNDRVKSNQTSVWEVVDRLKKIMISEIDKDDAPNS